ncbi:MAG: InlB B-repeat-containing protein, partial [Acholeplasmataceae bacterium]|nr:InlB B-repeat-containing protein [Acholeplasmataceae bacterium]
MRKILSIFVLVTVVLFAVACKKTTYNVTFESNGGSAVLPAVVEENKLLEEPDAPTKTGFTFDGWYKESALTNEWNFAKDLVTEDITLYAKWMATDAHLVDLAYDWLTLGDLSALTNQSARIIFPTTKDDVTISWDIDKNEYIAANGLISQPTHEEGTQTVTLTATLTKGSATREKEFTATVLALPNPEDAEPLIYETFEDYTDGNILGQDGPWGPVSGKSGNSLFTVVSTLTPMIPDGSKALKIEALKELQIEAPIVHDYDLVVIEVDLLQTTTSNGSAVNIQSSSSSPVIGFGLDGASLFYRTDNGDLMKTPIDINTWYTLRVEVDLVNKTIEAFYYEDGQLVPMTPDKVTYIGALSLQSIFIRSGSSTTEVLREPAYVTNLVVNRIEALPRPVEGVKLGEVTDISSTVSVEVGTSFTPDVPKVYNYYGSQGLLVKDTDYTLVISNPVDIETPDIYTVTYTITNKDDNTDVVVINQSVTVYAPSTPNEITNATSTVALYEEKLSTITVTVVQPEGTLYYLLSNNATETKEAIILGEQKTIDSVTVTLTDLDVGEFIYIHFYVELNGDSNILSHEINRQEVVEIATPQAFYDAIHLSESNQKPKYFLITADIDFTDYTWVVLSTTKLWTTLNGDNHTLSNLSIDRNVKGGIFSDAEDAIIKNLILDHIDVTSSVGVSTVLVGETRGNVLIENVVMMNSSIEITDTS